MPDNNNRKSKSRKLNPRERRWHRLADHWLANLKWAELKFMVKLLRHVDEDGVCWPARDNIVESCGGSGKTFKRALESLIAKGLLEIVEPGRAGHPSRGGRSTIYRVRVPKPNIENRSKPVSTNRINKTGSKGKSKPVAPTIKPGSTDHLKPVASYRRTVHKERNNIESNKSNGFDVPSELLDRWRVDDATSKKSRNLLLQEEVSRDLLGEAAKVFPPAAFAVAALTRRKHDADELQNPAAYASALLKRIVRDGPTSALRDVHDDYAEIVASTILVLDSLTGPDEEEVSDQRWRELCDLVDERCSPTLSHEFREFERIAWDRPELASSAIVKKVRSKLTEAERYKYKEDLKDLSAV